ncbi:MAG: hypothetical protein LBD22_01660 [Spirochaetaceae bacterium]|jgi:hypothetical protein|nr:hypothetical protein [Spirochaetaceae bacterium]
MMVQVTLIKKPAKCKTPGRGGGAFWLAAVVLFLAAAGHAAAADKKITLTGNANWNGNIWKDIYGADTTAPTAADNIVGIEITMGSGGNTITLTIPAGVTAVCNDFSATELASSFINNTTNIVINSANGLTVAGNFTGNTNSNATTKITVNSNSKFIVEGDFTGNNTNFYGTGELVLGPASSSSTFDFAPGQLNLQSLATVRIRNGVYQFPNSYSGGGNAQKCKIENLIVDAGAVLDLNSCNYLDIVGNIDGAGTVKFGAGGYFQLAGNFLSSSLQMEDFQGNAAIIFVGSSGIQTINASASQLFPEIQINNGSTTVKLTAGSQMRLSSHFKVLTGKFAVDTSPPSSATPVPATPEIKFVGPGPASGNIQFELSSTGSNYQFGAITIAIGTKTLEFKGYTGPGTGTSTALYAFGAYGDIKLESGILDIKDDAVLATCTNFIQTGGQIVSGIASNKFAIKTFYGDIVADYISGGAPVNAVQRLWLWSGRSIYWASDSQWVLEELASYATDPNAVISIRSTDTIQTMSGSYYYVEKGQVTLRAENEVRFRKNFQMSDAAGSTPNTSPLTIIAQTITIDSGVKIKAKNIVLMPASQGRDLIVGNTPSGYSGYNYLQIGLPVIGALEAIGSDYANVTIGGANVAFNNMYIGCNMNAAINFSSSLQGYNLTIESDNPAGGLLTLLDGNSNPISLAVNRKLTFKLPNRDVVVMGGGLPSR